MWIQTVAIILPRVQQHFDGEGFASYAVPAHSHNPSLRQPYWVSILRYVCWDDVRGCGMGFMYVCHVFCVYHYLKDIFLQVLIYLVEARLST